MQIFLLNAMADRTLKWFVHHDCRRLYSSTAGGAWRQVLCQSADTRQKNVFNRIASPRKESDWLWHVIDAKVRAWIRFILSIHTPPKPSFHIKHKTHSHSRSSPPATTELLLFKRTSLRGQGLISILIAVYCTKGWSISLWSDMDKLNTLFF